jgi:hypothetical protein
MNKKYTAMIMSMIDQKEGMFRFLTKVAKALKPPMAYLHQLAKEVVE